MGSTSAYVGIRNQSEQMVWDIVIFGGFRYGIKTVPLHELTCKSAFYTRGVSHFTAGSAQVPVGSTDAYVWIRSQSQEMVWDIFMFWWVPFLDQDGSPQRGSMRTCILHQRVSNISTGSARVLVGYVSYISSVIPN